MDSLQQHVFEDGEWVARTVTAGELFGETSSHPRTESRKAAPPKPPTCGILTRTIIESPVVRWVLPVQLRSSRFNDVALVGDQSVQISELDADRQLKPVAKKVFLGAKIRNCQVMGVHDYLTKYKQHVEAHYTKYGFDSDPPSPNPLPNNIEMFQQLLVLALSSRELVFLFMSLTANGDWEFVSSEFSTVHGELVDPGFHMTISPDSRYLALSCSQDLFVVYKLETIEKLRKQHREGLPIAPIQSIQARAVRGAIQNFEFLHNSSENTSHVVLLVITARSGVFRLAIYDWEDEESLNQALDHEISGVRLDGALGVPLLIVPLMVSCQFIIVTDHSTAICSEVLGGSPEFEPFPLADQDASDWHHGSHTPMWTAWTRPLREESYHSKFDQIYLGREDGWVNYLEISDSGIEQSIYMGPLECNIDSGFAAMSLYGDILVAGGHDGRGHIWTVEPRQAPKKLGDLPSWSPTVDLVLTRDASKHSKSDKKKVSKRRPTSAPGRIFACSGRDASGAIVELRYGLQAKIGLDLEYTSPIKKCWAIPKFYDTDEEGFLVLLALPDNSALLHISNDLSDVSEKEQSVVDFDLLSTTLAVHISSEIIIQITTMRVTILSTDGCYQHLISDLIEDQFATLIDAAITDGILILSVYSQATFKIMAYSLDNTKFSLKNVFEVKGEVTALSVSSLSFGIYILVGLSHENLSALEILPLNNEQERTRLELVKDDDTASMVVNAVTSITCPRDDKIIVGMRNGDVLTIQSVDRYGHRPELAVTRTNHFGESPSHVFTGPRLDTISSSLVCNDKGLVIIKEPNGQPSQGCFEEIFEVWLTDANEPHLASPTINSVTRLHELLGHGDSTWFMVSGQHIFITELQPRPAPVPRYFPVGGTPKGIIYSERLDALITVVEKKGRPSVHFFDPITGIDISRPVKINHGQHKETVDADYVSYLDPSTKIFSLFSWRYNNGERDFDWFVLMAIDGNNQGRILIVSAEEEEIVTDTGVHRQIRFWCRFVKKIPSSRSKPLRFGTTDANGLFLTMGTTLEYHVIKDKKFITVKEFELPSPATCVEVIDGRLHVSTTNHSLIILDYTENAITKSPEMVQLYTDEVARNGLHLTGTRLLSDRHGRRQRLTLMSDPLCGVYGLWPPPTNYGDPHLKLIFQAQLAVSIRKFVQGHTRPRWARDQPRRGKLPSQPKMGSILGLAIDGSLTQFSVLDKDEWRLLRYIQLLTMNVKDIYYEPVERNACCDPVNIPYYLDDQDDPDDMDCSDDADKPASADGSDSSNDSHVLQMDPNSIDKVSMHIDGDILQKCLEKKLLAQLVKTDERITQLKALLSPFGFDADESSEDKTLLAYEYAYSLLEYYLSSAV
ncbi:mono-functional DNA-alkylating methyl methanesulfonate N-term-domain-containing protein [Xylaria venustula]|nr:mono-functional DNA-alkylating methyl methanesulfonate N-term-domain-containing protein [Xylaria venustula]